MCQVGEKQRALETLQAETADNSKLIDDLHTSLESALQERDLLSEKLLELEHSIEQKVADRIATERNKAKVGFFSYFYDSACGCCRLCAKCAFRHTAYAPFRLRCVYLLFPLCDIFSISSSPSSSSCRSWP